MGRQYQAPFTIDFDLTSGICKSGKMESSKRYLSALAGMYNDTEAAEEMARDGDPLVYEFYEMDFMPETDSELRIGTSIVYPGKVGDEYFMTKGHFHTILDTAEVYYCTSGQGGMLMETPEGEVMFAEMKPGEAVYVGARWAHRSVNTGSVPMVSFFAFRSDAGHDYGTIEEKGYRKLVVEVDGKPALIDNPKWGE